MLRVDREGVPAVVQKIRYVFQGYYFELTRFDGDLVRLDASPYHVNWLDRNPQIPDGTFFSVEAHYLASL